MFWLCATLGNLGFLCGLGTLGGWMGAEFGVGGGSGGLDPGGRWTEVWSWMSGEVRRSEIAIHSHIHGILETISEVTPSRAHPRRHPNPHPAMPRRPLHHLIDLAPLQRERRTDPAVARALEALPVVAPDARAALGVRAQQPAVELALLERAAHPAQRLDKVVRAGRRRQGGRRGLVLGDEGRRDERAAALFAAQAQARGVVLGGFLVLEAQAGGGLPDGDVLLDFALVRPALVEGVAFDVGRALHLPPQGELVHEARVGLGHGPGAADQGEGGLDGFLGGVLAGSRC